MLADVRNASIVANVSEKLRKVSASIEKYVRDFLFPFSKSNNLISLFTYFCCNKYQIVFKTFPAHVKSATKHRSFNTHRKRMQAQERSRVCVSGRNRSWASAPLSHTLLNFELRWQVKLTIIVAARNITY